MNTKPDFKSVLFGLILGVIATVAIAAASAPGQPGRYQIGATGNQGLVLDTVTGRVWSAYFSSGGGREGKDFFRLKLNVEKE